MEDPLPFALVDTKYRDVAKADVITNYWKLDTIDPNIAIAQLIALDETAFAHDLAPRRARYLQKRQQRDMVLYERCTVEELKKFCVDRGIKLDGPGHDKPQEFIKALERADRTATFPKFRDLPAELREGVYHQHITTLKPDADFCTEPPLLRASRQLRNESIPLFYRARLFTISLPIALTENEDDPKAPHQRAAKQQRLMGPTGPAEVLARVQKLRVDGEVSNRGTTGRFVFELGEGCEDGVKYVEEQSDTRTDPPIVAFWEQLLTARLRCLRARFEARGEEGLQLRAGDLEQLLQILGRTLGGVKEAEMKV